MKIHMVDLKRQYDDLKPEIDESIRRVIEKSAFIGGEFVSAFEKNFADYVGAKYCVGVGNGTESLFIALKCLGVKTGDEVIVPANSFIATSEAVSLTGAKPVFVDCKKDTYNIDPQKIEKAITKHTKAIIPVHLYGQPAEMDKILEISEKYNLFIVEDAAQAHGAKYQGENVGTFGNAACFSFFPGKNLGAYGDAGAIVTNNNELAEKARMFANHGRKDKYNHEFEGINSRLDGMQAAILSVKLKYLPDWTKKRREAAEIYDNNLKDFVVTPSVLPDVEHVYHLYVIQTEARDKLRSELKELGIETGVHYPAPLPFTEAYRHLGHKPEDFPAAHGLKDKILSLPMHENLTKDQIEYVVGEIKRLLTK